LVIFFDKNQTEQKMIIQGDNTKFDAFSASLKKNVEY
jgi:hypothetical protein